MSLFAPAQVTAAEFCVGTSEEFQAALFSASAAWEDSIILVEEGSYPGVFGYGANQAVGLRIEGGYAPGCNAKTPDPSLTTMDGGGLGSVLQINALLDHSDAFGSELFVTGDFNGGGNVNRESLLMRSKPRLYESRRRLFAGQYSFVLATKDEGVVLYTEPNDTLVPGDSQTMFSADAGQEIFGQLMIPFDGCFVFGLYVPDAGQPELSLREAEIEEYCSQFTAADVGPSISIDNLTIENGVGNLGGGLALNIEGAFVADNIVVKNNYAEEGGGIYVQPHEGRFEFRNCSFESNHSNGDGGAIGSAATASIYRGGKSIDGCSFIENSAKVGGAVRVSYLERITNSFFYRNTALVWGAVSSANEVSYSRFVENSSTRYWGGAMGSSRSIIESVFVDNYTVDKGGAVGPLEFDSLVLGNRFKGNRATRGGAIYINKQCDHTDRMEVHHNEFLDNEATGVSGAAAIEAESSCGVVREDGIFSIRNNVFHGNVGGTSDSGTVVVRHNAKSPFHFIQNTATNNLVNTSPDGACQPTCTLGPALRLQTIMEPEASDHYLVANNLVWNNLSDDQVIYDFYIDNQDDQFFARQVSILNNSLTTQNSSLFIARPAYSEVLDTISGRPRFHVPDDPFSGLSILAHQVDQGIQIPVLASDVDALGNPRYQGPRPDIGAYEATSLYRLVSSNLLDSSVAVVHWSDIASTFVGASADAVFGTVGQEIVFLPDSIRGGEAIDDVSGNGSPELAVFGVTQDRAPRVQLRDITSGESIRNQGYFDATWHPLDMVVLGDLASDGPDDLGVLAENLSTGEIAVQVRDAATGSFTGNVFFLNSSWRPLQVMTFGELDTNPGQELGVLATNNAGQIVVMIKDTKTNSFIKNIFFLNANWIPVQAIVLDDISDNGAQEIGLLAENKDSGQLVFMVKDAATNTFINNVFPLGSGWEPIKVVALPDENANGSQELAVLGVNEATGKLVVQVRDSLTGQFLRNLEPLGSNWDPRDMIVLFDIGGGVPGLSVLATRKSDGLPVVQTIEGISGDLVSNVFPD